MNNFVQNADSFSNLRGMQDVGHTQWGLELYLELITGPKLDMFINFNGAVLNRPSIGDNFFS